MEHKLITLTAQYISLQREANDSPELFEPEGVEPQLDRIAAEYGQTLKAFLAA